jgi:transposase-like protein
MANDMRIGLAQLVRKVRMEHDADLLKEGVRVLSQALMEMEIEEHVGAARYERSPGRVGQRNGYRERSWDTRVGTVELKVPRVREAAAFPRSSNREGGPGEPWQQSSRKPTSTASAPARWMSW